MKYNFAQSYKKQVISVACFFFFVGWVQGQSAYTFLNVPPTARLAALGGINVSLADRDVNFFSANPSLAGDTLNGFASANYQFYLADIGRAHFAYQHQFKKVGSMSFAVQHFSYGKIDSYDPAGLPLGTFNAGETALMAGKYFTSKAFRFGVTAKTIFSNLAGFRSTALAMDLGGLFVHPKQNLTIGLAIKNVGIKLTEYTESSNTQLPFDVQVGTTFKPEHMPFRFSITAFDLTDFDNFENQEAKPSTIDKVVRHLNVGTELLLSKNVNILLGYNFRRRQELKVEEIGGGAGLSLGLSLQIKTVELVLNRVGYGPRQASYGFTLSSDLKKIIRKREKI
ncbi:MAG: hypothetical protein EBR30_16330 [Cytophagia bacterium]|nr:hypothetical protein [Cytophagia bacterium]